MASSPAAHVPAAVTRPDNDAQPLDPRGSIEELVKAPVCVEWDGGPSSLPSLSTLALLLCIRLDAQHLEASFQFQLRNVQLARRTAKRTFHLFVPPERIESLSLAGTEHSTPAGHDTYRLAVVLLAPLDLVGPPSYECHKGWPGGKDATKKLVSLAGTLRFTILVPVSAIVRTRLLDFCAAASTPGRLQSLEPQHHRLYGGAGGYLYTVDPAPVPSSPEAGPSNTAPLPPPDPGLAGPGDLPAMSPASEQTTAPADTPPQYRDACLPAYVEAEAHGAGSKTPGKRENSQEADAHRPAKRRDHDAPSHGERHASTATTASGTSGEGEPSLPCEPALADLVRSLVVQNQRLRDELAALRKSHNDLGGRLAEACERQDDMDNAVESLDGRACALEEDWDEATGARGVLPDMHFEASVAVRDMLVDMFAPGEPLPPAVAEAIEERVANEVAMRFAYFQERLQRALDHE